MSPPSVFSIITHLMVICKSSYESSNCYLDCNIADKVAAYLARINIYWDEEQWKYLLYKFIKLRIDLINSIINNQWDVGFELQDRIDDIIIVMANYMARGIIALQQTPVL